MVKPFIYKCKLNTPINNFPWACHFNEDHQVHRSKNGILDSKQCFHSFS